MSPAPQGAVGLGEGVRIALEALWSNKLRSFLTVLGNIIAVMSIILVVSIIQGVNAEVTDLLAGQGADVFTVEREGIAFSHEASLAMRNRPRLTMDDARFLRNESSTIQFVAAGADNSARIDYRTESVGGVGVRGRSYDWTMLESTGLQAGRYFSPLETDRNRPVALLGPDIVEQLMPSRAPAAIIGERIRVNGLHFTVIGVMDSQGTAFGFSQDEYVVVPLGVFLRMFGTRQSLDLRVKPRHPDLVEDSMEEARMLMRLQHRLRPRDSDDFAVTSSDTFLDLYHQFTAGIYGVLVGIVAMALVVGGIVIMNIMLMVVTERTREIGIRKAVGATYQQVLWQFLVEAVTLSVAGGVAGIATGYAIAATIASFTPLPFVVAPWSIATALATVMVIGVLFGIYPASRAAKLDPIAALRFE